jgi:membrane-associated protease RseP (regulator of RpoE activity)
VKLPRRGRDRIVSTIWWSDAVIPTWLTRVAALAAASGAGFVAALGAFWLLQFFDDDGELLGAAIVHPEVVLVVALGCGAAIGIATASGNLRRGVAVAGVLGLLGVAAVAAFLVWTTERGFSAREFRAAAAAGDLETMVAQARNAVEADALIDLSAAQVKRTLGPPSRISRRRHLYIWDLGMINDYIGPGDEGALYVQFDRSWRHARTAQVATGFD